MGDFWGRLCDPTGFFSRKACGDGWNPGLVWLHVGSDLAIWLAYCSIPLILLYFLRRKEDRPPFPGLLVLFAAFILLCGMTHFFDALMFEYPVYRINGLVRLATALVSWATVFALIPSVPKLLAYIHRTHAAASDTAVHLALGRPRRSWPHDTIIALLAATVAVLARALLDPILSGDHVFVLSLLSVVFVAWQCGFLPALITLMLSMTALVYFFVEPRRTFVIEAFSDQIAVALFFFCGVVCAVLGEAQRVAQRKSMSALGTALRQRTELEHEAQRRGEIQKALLNREIQLLESNDRLEASRRQTADALALLDTFFRNAPVGLAFFDRDLRYVRVNEYLARANGRPVEEHVGRALTDVLPHYPPHEVEAYRQVLRTGTAALDLTLNGVRPGAGSEAVWSLNLYPVTRPDGEVLGVGVVSEDVTDRRRAEQELRASEARFRLLTEAIPQMVWNADAAGEINYFNTRWREYTGVTVEAARQGTWVEAVHADDRQRVAEAWRLAIRQGFDRFISEFRLRRQSDGEYRWFLAAALPVPRADGSIDQWIGSLTDIDAQKRQRETLEALVRERTAELTDIAAALRDEVEERRRAEELVQATAQELQRSNEELEKFAYVASHDLQEPLRKIQAFGDRLQTRFHDNLPDDAQDYLTRMMRSAGRMRRLIDDLLTFSRVTSKGRSFAPVDLNAVLADAVSDLEVRIGQTGAAVDVGPLPTITADSFQIQQLFQNLLTNALKFQRPGEAPRIQVRGELVESEGEPAVRITVADNGIGFDMKYLDRIFEVFQRLHGREEYEGTGVGLAICRKIVERHGGTITAESAKGKGATFLVTLPIEPHQAESTPHGQAE